MKPLHVGVIVKAGRPAALERDNRATGYWSYAVPEFVWDFIPLPKNIHVDTTRFRHYDLIFHCDSPLGLSFGKLPVPLVYYSVDSTLSDTNHYLPRLDQAKRADLILLDHDRIQRFMVKGRKTLRWSYCVNDLVFRDYQLERTAEVVMHNNSGHAAPSQERSDLRRQLHDICAANGWRYRSGMLPLHEYAQSMNAAKVTVNWPRNPANRPHRVFDSMACRTCLLTGPLPDVSDEFRQAEVDYSVFHAPSELEEQIKWLLSETPLEWWRWRAAHGYEMVMQHHTWAVRAAQLRELLQVELGL